MAEVAFAVVRPGPDRSDVHRVRGAGPLRLLCPRVGRAAWIVTSSLGGGLVDGDHVELDVTIDAGATCVLTTQASSKIYKGTSSQRTVVHVRGDGIALAVPDPVVPYRDARYLATTRFELDAGASLACVDILTAGRVAFGERWSAARLDCTLELVVAGDRRLLDRVVLDPRHGEVAARMGRFDALATVVLVGPKFTDLAARECARIADVRDARAAPIVVAASPLVDGALFRIAGEQIEAVVNATRDLLREACSRCGEEPWARKW